MKLSTHYLIINENKNNLGGKRIQSDKPCYLKACSYFNLGYEIVASWAPFLQDFAMYMMTLDKIFYRRNIKPHCIHICKVNSTILCEIRYQKFTGVKPCLKYFNDNRNELQGLSRNMMKRIYINIYIYIKRF